MLSFFAHLPGLAKREDHLYREVLAEAFKLAWRQKRFWVLAFFASALLTMGSYDVVLTTSHSITQNAGAMLEGSGGAMFGTMLGEVMAGATDLLGVLTAFQVLAIASIIMLAIGAFSCICQGGLVFALGAMRRGDRPGLREALRIGSAAIWPVVALNALVLMTLWVLRFLSAFALYLVVDANSAFAWHIYLVSYILFMALSFVLAIVQIFALNALILQGAPVGAALVRGYELFKKNWLVTLETALLLLGSAFIITFAFGLLVLIMLFPFTLGVVASSLFSTNAAYNMLMGGGFALIVGSLFATVSFITQLQYATWTILYRRLGEGGIVPKLHRLYRDLTGTYKIPQA